MRPSPAVPVSWLRLEGAAVLLLAVLLYQRQGGGWLTFALLLLAPDLSMLGYLRGPRVGALSYNAFHVYLGPALLGTAAVVAGHPALVSGALIWFAHIGMDRALGYGLKLPTGFQDTDMGRIGRGARTTVTAAVEGEGPPFRA